VKRRHVGDDCRLLEGCLNGDAEAWSIFTQRYSGLIGISISMRLKKYGFDIPKEEIDDLRQMVLTNLWEHKKFADIKNREDISYWLAIISGNIAVHYLRRRHRLDHLLRIGTVTDIPDYVISELATDGRTSPLDETIAKELSEKIVKALEGLSDRERLIAKLNLLHGKKHEEISDMLSIPLNTVSSHVKRAKDKLKKYLKDLRDY
jgi:RNA polymerase sigma-70 factor (ECF subfamily)